MRRVPTVILGSLLLVPVGFTSAPSPVQAQDTAAIDKALAAAPARARDDATVIQWNEDHSYATLKEGSNGMVCYDRSSEARRAPFDVQCTSMGNLPRVAQNRQFRAQSADREAENALIEAAEANGSRVLPEFGSLWIAMRGQDREGAGTHTTIAVPNATAESLGLPVNGRQDSAWLMGAGTSGAHIMIPGS
ncbi:MAG: hypothetical protein HKN72_14455 [Gemmatimonadetes bacterium]|nr:hypothetical protein [Gemmatimonadota bacterium]